MGGRGNLNTLRKLFNWNSTWYNKNSYKQLLFRDLVIDVYLTSLFYKLRIASSYFFIKNSFFSIYIIECDLYLTHRQKLLSLFFNYKEFLILMRLVYSFFKKYGWHKVKKRFNSKYNRGLLTHTKTSFFGASWYSKISLLTTISNSYFFTYNIRNMVFFDIFYGDFYKTTTYSLNLVSKNSRIGYLYAAYSASLSKRNQISTNLDLYNKLLPETFFFIKYSTKLVLRNSFIWGDINNTISNSNRLFLLGFLYKKEYPFSKISEYSIKRTIFHIRHVKKNIFYRCRIMYQMISKLSLILSNKYCTTSVTFLKYLYSKIQMLGSLTESVIYLQSTTNFVSSLPLKYNSLLFSFVESCHGSDNNVFTENIFFMYYSSIFSWLSTKIEQTLISYTGSNYLFRPTVYLNYRPFITNSKILGEYVALSLSGGDTVNNVFKNIQQWIEGQHLFLEYRGTTEFRNRVLNSSYIPLKGVRIICKGPTSIARRKRKVTFHTWVSNNNITGKMPAQSLDVQVDFYQTFAVMPQASVGIKIWTLFEFIENC